VQANQPALIVTGDDRTQTLTFAELSARSKQVAGGLQPLGVARYDKFMMMLDNVVEAWAAMLAAIKIGAVILPTTVMLDSRALASRVERAGVQWALTNQQNINKFSELVDFGIDPKSVGVFVTGADAVDNTYAYTDA